MKRQRYHASKIASLRISRVPEDEPRRSNSGEDGVASTRHASPLAIEGVCGYDGCRRSERGQAKTYPLKEKGFASWT